MQVAVVPTWAWFLLIAVVVLAISLYLSRSRSKTSEPIPTLAVSKDEPKVIERTIEKMVLVVCPYCGHKNEQGMTKCQSCQGDI